MPIHNGSQKLKDIYIGGTKIKEIYNGSTLVYTGSQYDVDEVVFESSTAGTYSLELLETGKYEVYCVGGGGGGNTYSSGIPPRFFSSGGGSGGGFIGVINIVKSSYSIIVGNLGSRSTSQQAGGTGGSSTIGSLIICSGGIGGRSNGFTPIGGSGGTVTLNTTPVNVTLNSSGNTGGGNTGTGTVLGGASLYNGYGKGGDSNSNNARAGYVKIIYKGR